MDEEVVALKRELARLRADNERKDRTIESLQRAALGGPRRSKESEPLSIEEVREALRRTRADNKRKDGVIADLKRKQRDAQSDAQPAHDGDVRLVDIDANFLHEDLAADLSWHLKTAEKVGVCHFVTPACTLPDCARAIELAHAHPDRICVTAGVHPFWTASTVNGVPREDGTDFSESALAALRGFASHESVRCIGECGLDFVRPPEAENGFPMRESQLPWFEAQVHARTRACTHMRMRMHIHARTRARAHP